MADLRACPAFAALAALVACGSGESLGRGAGVDVSFQVARGGVNVPCASVPEITEVQVTVRSLEGAIRGGFPRPADCSSGSIRLEGLPDGDHELQISARGRLGADDRALLFNAVTTFATPGNTTVDVSLRPEVAFLSVGWTFDRSGLQPCDRDVADVEIIVSTGTTQLPAFMGRFACVATPVAVDVPLPLESYTIQINAYSQQEFILYSGTAVRALERGDNEVTVMMSAMGGRLFFDWTFAIAGQPIRACNDPRVGVTSVMASVRSLEGGQVTPPTETYECAGERPIGFMAQFYRPGRMLEVQLVAEGRERFKGVERFTMPSGDRYQDPPLVLEAVGTATAAVVVRTSTCSELLVDGIEIVVFPGNGSTEPVATKDLAAGQHEVQVRDLPFGDYQVEVSLARGNDRLCSVRERRVIDARWSTWDPFVL